MVCNFWFVSVFQGSLLEVVQFRAIIDYFASNIFLSFLFLSLARKKQCLPPSLDRYSNHHRDFLRRYHFCSCGPCWAIKARSNIVICINPVPTQMIGGTEKAESPSNLQNGQCDTTNLVVIKACLQNIATLLKSRYPQKLA